MPSEKSIAPALGALFFASFMTFADLNGVQPLLPLFTRDFHISPTVSGLAVSLLTAAIGISLIIYGPLSDAKGRKNIMSVVLLLAAVPTILAGFAQDFHIILIMRILQGILLGGLQSIAMAYIGEEMPKRKLPLAMGLYISGNSIGGMVGRIISGYIAEYISWRAVFWSFGLLNIIGGILFIFLLPASVNFHAHPFNLKGALKDMSGHIKKTTLLVAFIMGFFLMFAFIGTFNYVGFKLSEAPYFLNTAEISWIFVTYLSGTVSSTMVGNIAKKIGLPDTIMLCAAIGIMGLLITLCSNIIFFILGLLGFCFGFFATHSAASAWVSINVKEAKGIASALYLLFYYTGGALGGVLLGILWSAFKWPGVIAGAVTSFLFTILLSRLLIKIQNNH